MGMTAGFFDKHKKCFIVDLNMHVAYAVDFPGFISTLPERKNKIF